MLNLFPVDATSGAIDGITSYITELFSGIGGFIWLIIGIPLGFWIIYKIKGISAK
jgi:hypothetical protein